MRRRANLIGVLAFGAMVGACGGENASDSGAPTARAGTATGGVAAAATGGALATGGSGAAGSGTAGSANGGSAMGTGGSATAGSGTSIAGAAMGGSATGTGTAGAAMGGSATGTGTAGAATGGTGMGTGTAGSAMGGSAMGTGGTGTAGSGPGTGGSATGGSAVGGAATGGSGTAGSGPGTGGTGTGGTGVGGTAAAGMGTGGAGTAGTGTGLEEGVRIYLIGDSTMCNYADRDDYDTNYYPQAGWGEMLQDVMTPDVLPSIRNVIAAASVEVDNRARGGRSTRVFWEEGSWQAVLDDLDAGDYVFIQFGHNDSASCADYPDRCTSVPDYQQYLRDYIDTTRQKGATPILITPMNRNYPWNNGVLSNVHGDYPAAMKAVATEKQALLVDGTQRSLDLFNAKGRDFTTSHYFMVFAAGTYPTFKGGSASSDNTHFQIEGAQAMAQIVVEGLQDLSELQH